MVITPAPFSLFPSLCLLNEELSINVEVEGKDETIPSEKIIQSQTAWDDYTSEKDQGISSQELKRQLLSELMVG